jgi:hypothetical protein
LAPEVKAEIYGCPQSPQNLVANGADNAIELTWDEPAASDFVATSYQALVAPGDIVVDISAPATKATIAGLLNGKTYEVSLVALNEFGASEVSGPIEVTPTNGLDGVVGRLVVQYEDGVASTEAPGVATGSSSVTGIELVPEVDLGDGLHTVSLSEPVTVEDAAQIVVELESDSRVKWAEVDQVVTTAAFEPSQENLDPDYTDTAIRVADLLYADGKYSEAMPLYAQILQKNPHALDGQISIIVDQLVGTPVLLEQLRTAYLNTPYQNDRLLLSILGLIASRMRNYPEAIAAFGQLVAIQPNSIEALQNYTIVLSNGLDYANATIQAQNLVSLATTQQLPEQTISLYQQLADYLRSKTP